MDPRLSIDHVRQALGREPLRRLGQGYQGEAAVLMSILPERPPWRFLLTKRTQKVRTHKGQISFPGGFAVPGEDLRGTALRETEEELGIPPSAVQILGPFHDYLSITGALVRPFVGLVRPSGLIPNPDEVDSVLQVPISFFAATRPRVERRERHGRTANIYFWTYQEHEIWGLTARMIRDLIVSWFRPDWAAESADGQTSPSGLLGPWGRG